MYIYTLSHIYCIYTYYTHSYYTHAYHTPHIYTYHNSDLSPSLPHPSIGQVQPRPCGQHDHPVDRPAGPDGQGHQHIRYEGKIYILGLYDAMLVHI